MLEYDRWNVILLIVLYGYDTISMKKNRSMSNCLVIRKLEFRISNRGQD